MIIPTDIPIRQVTYNGTVVPIDTGDASLAKIVYFKFEDTDYEVYSVPAGGQIVAPTVPVKEGYTFKGWGDSASASSYKTFPYVPSADEETLYAVMQEIPEVTPYLTFSSANTFTLMVGTPRWDGTMEISTDAETWSTWNGSRTTAVLSGSEYKVYVRGSGNTVISGGQAGRFIFNNDFPAESPIACEGNIETLLDYATVLDGNHPSMGEVCCLYMFLNAKYLTTPPELPTLSLARACYKDMFYGCTNLLSAPALPALTVPENAYSEMFYGCDSLIHVPKLPALTVEYRAYDRMFAGCDSLQVYSASGSGHDKVWRIPESGTATGYITHTYMFYGTPGDFSSASSVSINRTFYTQNEPV